MLYTSIELETSALLATAARMCAAARTAPKARGADHIRTLVLTGAEKDALAAKMEEISAREFGDEPNILQRDAKNLRAAQAVVLIGVVPHYAGVPLCGMCGFANCGACQSAGGRCLFDGINFGIALSSAAAAAAQDRVDNRIMFSAGRAAAEMPYAEGETVLWHAIPLSITGKSIFFDRV